MNKEFQDYLKIVDVSSETLLKRIEELLIFASKMCVENDPIKKLFVCNKILPDGTNQLNSLWFLTDLFVMEVRNFQKSYDVDMAGYQGSVGYCRLITNSSDLENPTKECELSLRLVLGFGTQCTLESSGENCSYLWKIYKEFIKPNIV